MNADKMVHYLADQRRHAMTELREQGWTLGAIGRLYGLTRERVRQILNG